VLEGAVCTILDEEREWGCGRKIKRKGYSVHINQIVKLYSAASKSQLPLWAKLVICRWVSKHERGVSIGGMYLEKYDVSMHLLFRLKQCLHPAAASSVVKYMIGENLIT
jgi:hypothetical protein